MDRELLEDFFNRVADKWTGAELVELLEDMDLVNIHIVIAALEEFVVEAKERLEV